MGLTHATPQLQSAPTAEAQHHTPGQDAQSTFGNAFLQSVLGLGTQTGPSPEELAQQQQRDFLVTPWPPGSDIATGTGGLFDAQLLGPMLFVTLKVAYAFVPGDPASAPVGVTPAELAWTPAEENAFRARYATNVTGSWSFRHPIRSTLPHWTTQVNVLVNVVEDDADPHFRIRVSKYPEDVHTGGASVCDGGTHHDAGMCHPNAPGDTSGTALLDSNDVVQTRVRNGTQPVIGVWFDPGDATLDAGDRTALDAPVASLTANPAWNVELTGRSSAEGGATDNLTLARARTAAVEAEMVGRGVRNAQIIENVQGEQGATARNASDRRVDVHVIDVQTQTTAAHETGHMFGLSDEYLGTGEAPGTAFDPAYQQLIADNAEIPAGGLPTKGASDSIMSNGMDVQNWHYAPFVLAIKQITGSQDWTV